jgi:hypothetical protein
LIEIVTMASMGGIEQAKAGLSGLGLTGIAAGAALVGLGIAAKSAIGIAEDHAKAELNLAQAVGTTKLNLGQQQTQLTTFMQTNRDYISSQSDVINSYAQLIRTGLDQTQVQRVMNDALDLAAIKGISYSDAVSALSNAEFGRMRGLIDLGITTAKYTDANGNLVLAQHSVAQSMAEIDARVKAGRDSLTPLQKATNDLSNDWQDLALKAGPPLIDALGWVAKGLDQVLVAGQGASNDPFWSGLDSKLTDSAHALRVWWLSQSEHGRAQLAAEDLAAAGGIAKFGSQDTSGPPQTGATSFDDAKQALALLNQTGQGTTQAVQTIGTTIIPRQTQAEVDAANAAKADAKRLQDQNERIIAHLNNVEVNTAQGQRLTFNVQGLSAGDAQTARLLRKAMSV